MAHYKSSDQLTIPKTELDIDQKWIQMVTGILPKEGSISVTGNIQTGMGFLSNLCRVSFIANDSENQESFLVKLPPKSSVYMEFGLEKKVDQREIEFYSQIMPQLCQIDPELESHFAKYYNSKVVEAKDGEEYNSMLIFQDLKSLGYEIMDTESPKWHENMENLMKFFAKFHASGYALEKLKKLKIPEMFPSVMGFEEKEDLHSWIDIGNDSFAALEEILLDRKLPNEIFQDYKKISKVWKNIVEKAIFKARQFPCIIHSDMWCTNVMMADQKPVKVIDWQTVSYRDPVFDVVTTILLCLPVDEFNTINVNYFAGYYFNEFLTACSKYGSEYTARNEQEFMEYFNTWGMALGYLFLVLCVEVLKNEQGNIRLKNSFQFLHEKYGITDFLLTEVQ